ncbi:MAG TPA: TIGR03000 domain-containing protein [Gemmataceae bacterium]|nr:TIGR03000 domain-containing protein [Gemmataceae bacterium]
MGKIRTIPRGMIAALALLSTCRAASAGLFDGPVDFSIGPYRGQQFSYFESYNYFGVSNASAYPYWSNYSWPYFWESPYTQGSGSRYPSLFGQRPGFYNPINPAYLTPPRAPGYTRESAQNVKLPPMDQENGLAAVIDIKMPCFGELWVDDFPTQQLGTDRLFRSPPLQKGSDYIYVLKARWLDGEGKPVEQTQPVRLHSGQRVLVVFPKPVPPLSPAP